MKFSILCPTQLSPIRKTFILDAIDSVREQTYEDWELVIKVHEPQADLRVLYGQDLNKISIILNKDRGITDAMNQMMKFCTGDVFMWMNDDDKLLPHTLQTIKDNMGSYKWGFGEMLTDKGVVGTDCDIDSMRSGNHVCQPTVFWTREAYNHIGEMSGEQDLVSDYEYWVRLMKTFHHKFIDKPLAYYRHHPDQITNKTIAEQTSQAEIIRRNI